MAEAYSEPATGQRVEPAQSGKDEALDDAEKRAEILRDFRTRFNASKSHRNDWRAEARTLYDLVAGRQWDPGDEAQLREENRPWVTFNVSGKYMDAVQGLQINNRQQIRYVAREPGDLKVNELLTGAVAWGRDLTGMVDSETDAFYDCLVTGEGWMEALLDRDIDPAGVPTGERVDPLEMYPDPAAHKRNYADARYMIRVKYIDAGEFEELYGGDSVDETSGDFASFDNEEAEAVTVITEPQDYRGESKSGGANMRRRPVADYQWVERIDKMRVELKGAGVEVFTMEEWAWWENALKATKQEYTAEKIKAKCYYRAIIAGNRVHKWGKNTYSAGFTFKGITGKRDRNKRQWYGIGRSILDPQRWTNKFFSTILYAMMTNAKGGLLAEENTFKDARKAETDWANPSSIVWMKEGALQKEKVMPKPQAAYPQGLDRLMQFSLEALPQTSGLNLEIMGMADKVQAGVVEAQRKQSAMSIIAWAFDAMRRYYVDMGRTLAEYVVEYMPEGTLVQIEGEIGKQYVPLVKSQLNLQFDTIVDEAPTSVNQQERVWAVLQTIIPQLLEAGLPIPREVVDYAPLPSDLQQKWKEAMQPNPKAQQIQEKTAEETLRGIMAENAQKESTAKLNEAKAVQIQAELSNPQANPVLEMQMDAAKAQMEAQVEMRIAAFKTDREAETKLMVEQMKIESAERLALLERTIDAKLQQSKMESDANTKMALGAIGAQSKAQVAAIGAAAKAGQADDEEGAEEKPDPQAMLVDAIKELKETMAAGGQKAKGFTIERDKMGEMARVVLEY